MKEHFPDHPFARFVSKIASNTPAQQALANLEGITSMQPNLLLFCCWFAQAGQGRLDKQDIQELMSASTAWHARISLGLQKLNQLAERMNLAYDAKQAINSEYQFAQQVEQWLLIDAPIKFTRTARTPLQKITDACKNLVMYCKIQQIYISNVSCELLSQVLSFVFPAIDIIEITKTCRTILLNEAAQPYAQGKLILD